MQKSPLDMDLPERKIDLILRLYVDTADQDYIAARSAYDHGLFYVFYWCAAQACEKYMKAYLLLQEQEVQSYNHDLAKLFRKVSSFDERGIIPECLDLPATTGIGQEARQGEKVLTYVEHLNSFGSADNRYAFHGTNVTAPVLHALDITCYALRRMMNTSIIGGHDLFERQSIGLSIDESIQDRQTWMIDPTLLLERLFVDRYQVGQDPRLRAAFANMNFAFFVERIPGERTFGGRHFHGSPIHNHLVRLRGLEDTSRNRDIVDHLRLWASSNIKISKTVRQILGLPAEPRR